MTIRAVGVLGETSLFALFHDGALLMERRVPSSQRMVLSSPSIPSSWLRTAQIP